jgi:hypothetical protein
MELSTYMLQSESMYILDNCQLQYQGLFCIFGILGTIVVYFFVVPCF